MSFAVEITTDDILPTAIVRIHDRQNNQINCRTLLDSGSSANFITSVIVKTLNLQPKACSIPIGTLNGLTTVAEQSITLDIYSKCKGFMKKLNFLVVPQIASLTPHQAIDRKLIKIPKNITLADPQFHIPSRIDMLIGTGATLSILSVGQISLSYDPDLVLQKILLGWIVGGAAQTQVHKIQCSHSDTNIELSQF